MVSAIFRSDIIRISDDLSQIYDPNVPQCFQRKVTCHWFRCSSDIHVYTVLTAAAEISFCPATLHTCSHRNADHHKACFTAVVDAFSFLIALVLCCPRLVCKRRDIRSLATPLRCSKRERKTQSNRCL